MVTRYSRPPASHVDSDDSDDGARGTGALAAMAVAACILGLVLGLVAHVPELTSPVAAQPDTEATQAPPIPLGA